MARAPSYSKARDVAVRFGPCLHSYGEIRVSVDVVKGLRQEHLAEPCRWQTGADHWHAVPGLRLETLQRHLGIEIES